MLRSFQVTVGEPTPGHHDVYLVGIPMWAFREKYGQNLCWTTFSPSGTHLFRVIAEGPWAGCLDVT